MLRLQLHGTGSIIGTDGPVRGRASQGRQLALLAVLALARGRAVTRDKLIALFWPESTVDRARRQLSDTVYVIRAALGEVIRSEGDELRLDVDACVADTTEFEQLMEKGQIEAAVALLAGPLLDDFHLSDSPEFERWLDGARARIAERYANALATLAEESEKRGDPTAAVGWWRRLASHDPYSGRVALRV
ncbi:MAG: AfsR/SARP family transcriptional regulator, partial [Gemmatimonadaceae bacterium]